MSDDETLSKTQKTVSEFLKGKLSNRDENYYYPVCLYVGEEIAVD